MIHIPAPYQSDQLIYEQEAHKACFEGTGEWYAVESARENKPLVMLLGLLAVIATISLLVLAISIK